MKNVNASLFRAIQHTTGNWVRIQMTNMGKVQKNVEHDTISHNRSYSQSKTKNLASNHIEDKDLSIQ